MVYPLFVKISVSIVCIFLGFPMIVLGVTHLGREGAFISTILIGGAVSYLLPEVWIRKVEFDEDSLTVRSPWSKRRTVLWKDISRCSYCHIQQWYKLTSGHQCELRVSSFLKGCHSFQAMLLQKVSDVDLD
jgi:hypothetical protein